MCRFRRFSNLVLPAALLALVAGCAPLNFREPLQMPWVGGEKPQVPEEIVAVWKDAVLTTPNGPPTRGFGGRLMFYRDRGKAPVQVEGSLVVYAFDEDGRAEDDPRPTQKYIFTTEQFAQHYSKSTIGHSYSIWLPWDAVGGPQKTISLIVNFLPTDAGVVKAEQTRHILPGIIAPKPQLAESDQPQIRTVGHQEAVPPAAGDAVPEQTAPAVADLPQHGLRRMLTTTIEVPPQFGHRTQLARRRVSSPGAVPGVGAPAGMTTGTPVPQRAPWEYPATAHPSAFRQQRVPARAVSPRPASRQQSARSLHARSQPLGGSIAQLKRDHGLWQPRPVGSPYRRQGELLPPTEFGSASTFPGVAPRSH